MGGPRSRPTTAARSLSRPGCRWTWPGATPSSRPCGCSTGAWPCTWPTASSPAQSRRPSRSSGPSGSLRSTACCSASSARPGYLVPGSPGPCCGGRLEATGRQAQINTFGGGVNEVQREIVATAGLGMTGGAVSAASFEELTPFPDHSAALEGAGRPGGRCAAAVARRRQRADDPALGRGDGRHQPSSTCPTRRPAATATTA
jgi:hypothetical protein